MVGGVSEFIERDEAEFNVFEKILRKSVEGESTKLISDEAFVKILRN